MIKRVFLIVLDSFGIGELPDAAAFGDEGSNTLKTIQKSKKKCYTMIIYDRRIKTDEANKIIFINVFNTVFFFC